MSVDIILAAYNGELYIESQIDSILQQTYKDIRLYVRDDGSADKTMDIIKSINDPRLVILNDNKICKNVGSNFKELLLNTHGDYVFFADQDDIWLPTKVEETIKELRKIEGPGLVYVNGAVVDQYLKPSGKMVYTHEGCDHTLNSLLFLNGGIQGCATAINRELVELIEFENIHWYMHDQVVSYYASIYGTIAFVDKVLFLYRQHENNVIGYRDKNYMRSLFSLFVKKGRKPLIHSESLTFIQSFYEAEKDRMDELSKSLFVSFFMFMNKDFFSSLLYIIKYQFSLKGSVFRLLCKTVFFVKNEG